MAAPEPTDAMVKMQAMRMAGATPSELRDFVVPRARAMQMAGAGDNEILEYFGFPQLKSRDLKLAARERVRASLGDFQIGPAPKRTLAEETDLRERGERVGAPEQFIGAAPEDGDLSDALGVPPPVREPEVVEDIGNPWETIVAGFQGSSAELLRTKEFGDKVLSENAKVADQFLFGLGQFTGDLPAMLVGAGIGAIGGGGITGGIATPIAAFGGATVMPATIRHVISDQIRDGKIENWEEFTQRLLPTLQEATIEYTVGLGAGAAGQAVKRWVPGALGGKFSQGSAEIAAMVGIQAGWQQTMPNPKDFLLAGATILVLRGTTASFRATRQGAGKALAARYERLDNRRMAAKLRRIWVRTNIPPEQVLRDIERDPTIVEHLNSDAVGIPRSYHRFIVDADPLLVRAAETVAHSRRATVSGLRRELGVSRAEAEVLLGELQDAGLVGERTLAFSQDRAVLVDSADAARRAVDPSLDAPSTGRVPGTPGPKPRAVEGESESPGEMAPLVSIVEAETARRVKRTEDALLAKLSAKEVAQVRLDVVAEDLGLQLGNISEMAEGGIAQVAREFAVTNKRGEVALDALIKRLAVREGDASGQLALDQLGSQKYFGRADSPEALAYRAEIRDAVVARLEREGLLPRGKKAARGPRSDPEVKREGLAIELERELRHELEGIDARSEVAAGKVLDQLKRKYFARGEMTEKQYDAAVDRWLASEPVPETPVEARAANAIRPDKKRAAKPEEPAEPQSEVDLAHEALNDAVSAHQEAIRVVNELRSPQMTVKRLREAGILPDTKSRKGTLVKAAEKRRDELELEVKDRERDFRRLEPERPPERTPFDEESLPEQIADVQMLIKAQVTSKGALRRKEAARKQLERRLDALEKRMAKEREEPGSGRPPESIDKDVADILDRVAIGGKDPKKGFSFSEFYRKYKDENWPLFKIARLMEGGKDLRPAIENEYKLKRLFLGVIGKSTHFLEYSPFRYETFERVGRALKDILKPQRKNLDPLRAFMIAKRVTEDLEPRRRAKILEETPEGEVPEAITIPMDQARRVVRQFEAELGPIHRDLVEYNRFVLEYLRDSGVVGAESFDLIVQLGKNYVPLWRVFDIEELTTPSRQRPTQVADPLFRINVEGSERMIHDPLESMIKNTYAMITMAERNGNINAFIDHVIKTNSTELAVQVKAPVRMFRLDKTEMKKIVKKMEEGENLSEGQREAVENFALEIFRPQQLIAGRNQVVRFKDGKREVWEVPQEIADIFTGLDRQQIGDFIKIMSVPARSLRAGAVLSVEFMARNPIRDTMVAFLQSDSGFNIVADTAWGAFAVIGRTRLYQDWLRSGGPMAELAAMDRVYLQADLADVTGQSMLRTFTRNVFPGTFEGLRIVSQITEQATRVGEFGRVLRREIKGKKGAQFVEDRFKLTGRLARETAQDIAARVRGDELPDRRASKADILEAGFASREISLDFGRLGARSRAVNNIITFFNAQAEGTDRLLKTIAKHPLRTFARVSVSITLPTIMLRVLNEGEYYHDQIPRWQKDFFWMWPTYVEDEDGNVIEAPDGSGRPLTKWHRLSMPFGWGFLFGGLVNRAIDHIFKDDPTAFDGWLETMIQTAFGSFVPQAFLPYLSAKANEDQFTQRPLIPADREGALPEVQATQYTTELTQALGSALANLPFGLSRIDLPFLGPIEESGVSSPILIDNLLKLWGGAVGQTIRQLANDALIAQGILPDPVEPERSQSDIIGAKAFAIRVPAADAVAQTRFWKRWRRMQKVFRSVAIHEKEERLEKAAELRRRWEGRAFFPGGAPFDATGFERALTELTLQLRYLDMTRNIPAHEKQDLMDKLRYAQIAVAKAGNQVLDQMEKDSREVRKRLGEPE